MKSDQSSARENFFRHVCQTSPFSAAFEVQRASGCLIYDSTGREYLDFISGIAVTNVGHCHPAVVDAVVAQARNYAHTMVYGEHVQMPQVELARAIAEVAPAGLDSVYFLSTGSEANDAALKMAAKLTGRTKFCAFQGAYHGDTVGALSCLGDEAFRAPFAPMLLPVTFLDFGAMDSLSLIDENIAAVIVEPVQGEAGIRLPPPGFLPSLRARCDAVGALLIFDEVQTGFGRVGDWFAALRFNVTPNMITMAKGMGAGYPLAGLLGARDTMTRFAADPPFSHITTFGGHPVSCAAGLAAMEVVRSGLLLRNANEMGGILAESLQSIARSDERIRDVRGVGLMIGVELASSKLSRKVINHCREHGLILETTLLNERTIRFSPPLVVTREQCERALELFSSALGSR
jgi:acetylornithine/succinyldiaminopimelate/putrescine aminotransferase